MAITFLLPAVSMRMDARSTDTAHLALRYVTYRVFVLLGWASTPNKFTNQPV